MFDAIIDLLVNRNAQRAACAAALIGVCYWLGAELDNQWTWCLLALMYAIDQISYNYGVAQGVYSVITMSNQDLKEMREFLDVKQDTESRIINEE